MLKSPQFGTDGAELERVMDAAIHTAAHTGSMSGKIPVCVYVTGDLAGAVWMCGDHPTEAYAETANNVCQTPISRM